jgi:hypothetical protein
MYQKRSRGFFACLFMRFGRAMDQINNGVPDCWMEVHDSYQKLFAPLPGQADITHCGGHFYESTNQPSGPQHCFVLGYLLTVMPRLQSQVCAISRLDRRAGVDKLSEYCKEGFG